MSQYWRDWNVAEVESIHGNRLDLKWVGDSIYTSETWDDSWGPLPKVGELFVVRGHFGGNKEGFERLDGTVLRDKAYYEEALRKQVEGWRREHEENFRKNGHKWVKEVSELLEPFRKRMQRFIDEGGDSFWKSGSGTYELFIMKQAEGLYQEYMTCWQASADWKTKEEKEKHAEEWFNGFEAMSPEQQSRVFKDYDNGHSGNTHGAMIYLAHRVALGYEI